MWLTAKTRDISIWMEQLGATRTVGKGTKHFVAAARTLPLFGWFAHVLGLVKMNFQSPFPRISQNRGMHNNIYVFYPTYNDEKNFSCIFFVFYSAISVRTRQLRVIKYKSGPRVNQSPSRCELDDFIWSCSDDRGICRLLYNAQGRIKLSAPSKETNAGSRYGIQKCMAMKILTSRDCQG